MISIYNKDKQNATIKRYQAKSYKRYNLMLHNVADRELIAHIESEKAKGNSPTQTVRKLYKITLDNK